jgi:DNA-binding transcriptional LysR family regulator
MQGHDLLLRSRLKVRQLATLIAIADAGSLRGAAAVLRVSQPALSKTVRELEAVFDRALFVRESRGLRQTSHGTAVIDYARRLLRDVDALTSVLAAVDSGAGGRLRVGAIPYVSLEWLRATLKRMLDAQPPVAIQLVEGATDLLVGRLRNRELDCVIGRVTPTIAADDLETRLLFKQTLRVIVRSGHPLLRKGKRLELAHLRGCEWILAPATTPTRQLLDRVFVQAGLPAPRARLETYVLPIIQSFLSTGDALAALPNDIAQQCVRSGGFRALPFAWEMPPVCLVWLKRDEGNVLVQRFGEAAGLGRDAA